MATTTPTSHPDGTQRTPVRDDVHLVDIDGTEPHAAAASSRRSTAARGLATIGALFSLLVLGGLPALLLSAFAGTEELHRMHGIGWGLLTTLGYGGLLAVAAARPSQARPSLLAAVAVPVVAVLAGVAAGEPAVVLFAVLGLLAVGVLALRGDAQTSLAAWRAAAWDRTMLGAAGVGGVVVAPYVLDQLQLQRDAVASDPHVATDPHYLVMAMVALAIVTLAVIGARRMRDAWIPGMAGALAAIILGATGLALPDDVGAPATAIAVGLVAVGIALGGRVLSRRADDQRLAPAG